VDLGPTRRRLYSSVYQQMMQLDMRIPFNAMMSRIVGAPGGTRF
jgi:hypothetical protein